MNHLKQKALLCLLLLPTKESSQPALHCAFSYFYEPTHVYVHTHTHTHTRTHTQSTNCKSTLGDWLQGYRAPYARSVHILESKTPRTHLKEKNTGIWWFSGTHTEALTFHAYGRLKSNWKPSAGRGALLQGDSSPRRCSEQPLYAYWHHQERLGGRGYYGNQAMCWETEAFNCFNNFLGLELPGLGLLSRGWRLTEAARETRSEGTLNKFGISSLQRDFWMTNAMPWPHEQYSPHSWSSAGVTGQ